MNSDGHNPVFSGPTLIHFQKDSSIFGRFLLEMCAHNTNIRDLRIIGTDQEIANFYFTKSEFIVMPRSLGSRSKQKISNLDHQKEPSLLTSTVVDTVEFKNMVWQILQILTTFMQN